MIGRRAFLAALAGAPVFLGATAHEPLSGVEQRIFEAVNFQRTAFGFNVLAWDPVLCRTAREHSRRMLDAHFFSHEDPLYGNLAGRLNAAGVVWLRGAENLFRENGYTDPAAIAIVEWMYSPGHRENLLTADYRLTGVGVAMDEEGNFTATQQFLVPR